MIVYYLGIPGSGKSYSGVNLIYNNFTNNDDEKKDLKKGYINAYTNINEFRFDLCFNVIKFDYDVFLKNITFLHDMYKNKASDNELIEKAKEFNIYKTLFVLDECHQYFDVEKKVLIWWLTYHRHLYHDIIMITQNLALVNSKYKPLAEAFYKAKSSSLTLSNKFFNYMYYTESRMTKASFVNTVKVLKRDNVFKLYKSGDKVDSKNVIKRFIYISIGLAVLLFFIGFMFYHYIVPKKVQKIADKDIVVQTKTFSPPISSYNSDNIDGLIFIQFICNNDMCSFKDKYFDIKVLSFARSTFDLHIINSRRYFSSVLVSCSVNSSFLNFINGGLQNDEQINADNILPFSSNK